MADQDAIRKLFFDGCKRARLTGATLLAEVRSGNDIFHEWFDFAKGLRASDEFGEQSFRKWLEELSDKLEGGFKLDLYVTITLFGERSENLINLMLKYDLQVTVHFVFLYDIEHFLNAENSKNTLRKMKEHGIEFKELSVQTHKYLHEKYCTETDEWAANVRNYIPISRIRDPVSKYARFLQELTFPVEQKGE